MRSRQLRTKSGSWLGSGHWVLCFWAVWGQLAGLFPSDEPDLMPSDTFGVATPVTKH